MSFLVEWVMSRLSKLKSKQFLQQWERKFLSWGLCFWVIVQPVAMIIDLDVSAFLGNEYRTNSLQVAVLEQKGQGSILKDEEEDF